MSSTDGSSKFDKTKLKNSQLEFMKIIESQNRERALKLKALKRKNWITGGILIATALSIYSYSIFAVRQETFLDDFEEPAKTIAQ